MPCRRARLRRVSAGPRGGLARWALHVRPFLDASSRVALSCLARDWQYWELFGDCPLAPPGSPRRRQHTGFGKLNPQLTVQHSLPSGYWLIHQAWDFLSFAERHHLAAIAPAIRAYAYLRRSSATVRVASLQDPRPPPDTFTGLQWDRAWRMAVALLRFNFDFGNLIRWLEGEYTNEHRDWQALCDTMNAVRSIPPPAGYPLLDFDRAFRVCTEGVPLAGTFSCSFDSVRARNLYNNHPGLLDVEDDVRFKLAKEEAQSFHIAMPRFLWRFIPGIHLNLFVWHIRKGKGRLCVDPSTTISAVDDGNANASIPDPGTLGREDECPAIYYATALHRHLTHIWNLRITHPTEDILQFVDDIQAAFHRILYHPDGMKLFASVFCEFLIFPVGTIFGARNSPSFFCLLSESRAHIASTAIFRSNDDPDHLTELAQRVRLVPDLTDRERRALVPAVVDARHSGVPSSLSTRYHNSTFVDDNGIVALRCRIRGAIDNSVRAAYAVFGLPGADRRAPCLSTDKWMEVASYAMLYLGFFVDTRRMIMAWPVDKRLQLAGLIDDLVARRPCLVSPRESSSLLGLIRNAAPVAPLGVYLSLRLQHVLNKEIQSVWHHLGSRPPRWWRGWYRRTGMEIPPHSLQDLRLLRLTLDDNPHHPAWCRPIGLLVDREPTHECLSDASYDGLGAWSPLTSFGFMWRLTRSDLLSVGFDMTTIDADTGEPDGSNDGLHINILEFIAIIIELWFVLVFLQQRGHRAGGYVIHIRADNTSALSWMRYAARSHRPVVRELSRFFLALILASPVSFKLSGSHIRGMENCGADALSRPSAYPTWASVIEHHSPLVTCQAYRVPFPLLSTIASIISSAKTGAVYAPPTIELLTLAPTIMSTGSANMAQTSSLYRSAHRSKRSR